MKLLLFFALLVVAGSTAILAGCGSSATQAEQTGFAPGAFPPTLSDMDYHQKAWSRRTCLSCHEHGLKESPVIRHESVPPEAKQVKCRTCHVLVPESKPRY